MKAPTIAEAKRIANDLRARGVMILAYDGKQFGGASYGHTRADCRFLAGVLDTLIDHAEQPVGIVEANDPDDTDLASQVRKLRWSCEKARLALDRLGSAPDESVSPREWNEANGDSALQSVIAALAWTAPPLSNGTSTGSQAVQ
jgi:hypothetical protein